MRKAFAALKRAKGKTVSKTYLNASTGFSTDMSMLKVSQPGKIDKRHKYLKFYALLICLCLLIIPFHRIFAVTDFEKNVELLKKGTEKEREFAAGFLGKLKDRKAVIYLREALDDKSWLVRLTVISSLYKLGESGWEEIIMEALVSLDRNIRRKAAGILQEVSYWERSEFIIQSLKDEDIEVRKEMAIAAGNLKTRGALEPLILMLKDNEADIREVAATALGIMGDPKALKPLLAALEDSSPKVVRAVIISLSNIGDEEMVKPMIRMLGHKDRYVRYFSVKALGEFGDRSCIKPIIELIRDKDPKVRLGVIEVLGDLKREEDLPLLKEVLQDETDPYVRIEIAKNLILMGDRSVYSLIKNELFNRNIDLKSKAIEITGIIKDKETVPVLLDFIRSPNFEIKEISIWALGEIGDKSVFEILLEKLPEEKEFVKSTVIDALRKFKDKRLVPYLEKYLEDENFLMRKRASSALSYFTDSGPVIEEKLVQLLDDEYFEVRQAALGTLVRWKSKKAVKRLFEIAEDSTNPLQVMAISALSELNDKEVMPILSELYQKEKRPRYKLLFVTQLASLGDYRGKDFILEMVKSDDFVLRKQAAEALPAISNFDIYPVFSDLLNDHKMGIKLAAIKTLSQIYDPRTVDILIDNLQLNNIYLEREIEKSLIQLQTISVEPLIKAFYKNKDSSFYEKTGSVLVKIGVPAIAPLIKEYQTQDNNIKEYIMKALAGIGKDSLKPLVTYWDGEFKKDNTMLVDTIIKISYENPQTLVDFLDDEFLRNKTVSLLGRVSPDKIFDLILAKLSSHEALVRIKATETLVKIGTAAIDKLLARLPNSDAGMQLLIIEVLSVTGSEKAVLSLEKLVNETSNAEIKEAAGKAIIKMRQTIASIEAISSDKSQLEKLHRKKKTGKISIIEKDFLFINLGWGDEVTTGMIFEILGKDNNVINQLQITEVAGNNISIGKLIEKNNNVEVGCVVEEELKETEASEAGSNEVRAQLDRLKDKGWEVRMNALDVLSRIGDETSIPELVSFLNEIKISLDSTSVKKEDNMNQVNVLRSAVWALGEIEYRILSGIYQKGGNKISFNQEKEDMLNKVINIFVNLFSDTDSGVRLAAIRNITRLIAMRETFGLKNDFLFDPICNSLKDNDNYVKRAAVEALAELKDARAVPFLAAIWDDSDASVRGNVGWAMERIGQPAVPVLKEALKDQNDEKKQSAAKVLYKLGYRIKRVGNNFEILE